MEKTFAQISELFDQFSKDASLQVEKGNKAVLETEVKNIDRYGNGGIACTISKKNFSFHSGEALLVVIKLNINYVKFLFRF